MDNKEVALLKKALERQKKARKQAEKILEEKSKELYDVMHHLKSANNKLEGLLNERTSELDGEFINIIDPYVVMDLKYNVINMNLSAKEFLGFDHTKELVNLSEFVHRDYLEYTTESMRSLMEVGVLRNYRAKIITRNNEEKWVQINCCLIFNKERKPIAAQGILRDISQEMEIKQMLSEQKKQLDVIVENSPLGIVLSVDGRIVKTNSTFCEMVGYSESELKQVSIPEISRPEDEQATAILWERFYAGKLDKFAVTKEFFKKDKSTFLAKVQIGAVTDIHGNMEYQVALIEDISKEREAERQLKASENRLATLIANLHTGVLLEDENRKIALVNQMFCDLFHISTPPEQMIGIESNTSAKKTKIHLKHPEKFVERVDELLENREIAMADEVEMSDGRILERDYIPIFTNGNYKGHLWTYEDVTIRKNYKKNLEAQREKYSSIIANMNLGLVEVDNHDVILMVNQSYCDMIGFSKEELLGKNVNEMAQFKDEQFILKKNKERLRGETDSYEVSVRHKNGSLRHWLISGAPRFDDSGIVVGSIGIHLDITDQKLLEFQKEKLLRELESSNQNLQEYAHIVSHDLKSPLRSISALATWLTEDYKDKLDEGGLQNLELMQEKIASMDRLIHGILEYSTANSSELDNTDVDTNEVIAEIKDSIFIPEHVELLVPEVLPTIKADKTKMHQLFQNIIGNAVVHIEKEVGLVEVLYTDENDFWKFTIKDNGVGIPEKYHKKIFDIFQSIGDNERSTGIGLSIVKKIIDRYEGKVWVDSTLGKGTQFHFTIKKNLDT
ncbi:PAS domain S-box protein [Maribacter luteus]|uniref:histidine kinase n=1 Tax=Maribacter luteus TaxID=2594478 RepID=A0A6I2MUW2_9FLAO|nr:PAS domain S-box protein [Maribacter luteus]MRX66314.1 PAS domain S-box protein [Maribacter luteus]